jgi:hypothetical protein
MDVVERVTISLKKASKHWNIPLTSACDHLYGKTRFKKTRLASVLIAKEDQVVIFWVLAMQDVGLSINVQQLKMKGAKFTQRRSTPFQGGILKTLGGTSLSADILSSTFVKLKDWISIELND